MDEAERRALEAREALGVKRATRFKTVVIMLMVAVLIDISVAAPMLWDQPPPTGLTVIILALVTIGLAALTGVLAHARGDGRFPLVESPGRRDREQKARTAQMLTMPVCGLIFAAFWAMRSADILDGDLDLSAGLAVLAGVLWAGLLPAMVMGWDGGARRVRRFLEDELTQAFRARAIIAGFWALLPGVAAAYVVGLWRPEWAVLALPLVMMGAGAVASLRFALLHRAAERDE